MLLTTKRNQNQLALDFRVRVIPPRRCREETFEEALECTFPADPEAIGELELYQEFIRLFGESEYDQN